jgi:hypothetical protein
MTLLLPLRNSLPSTSKRPTYDIRTFDVPELENQKPHGPPTVEPHAAVVIV